MGTETEKDQAGIEGEGQKGTFMHSVIKNDSMVESEKGASPKETRKETVLLEPESEPGINMSEVETFKKGMEKDRREAKVEGNLLVNAVQQQVLESKKEASDMESKEETSLLGPESEGWKNNADMEQDKWEGNGNEDTSVLQFPLTDSEKNTALWLNNSEAETDRKEMEKCGQDGKGQEDKCLPSIQEQNIAEHPKMETFRMKKEIILLLTFYIILPTVDVLTDLLMIMKLFSNNHHKWAGLLLVPFVLNYLLSWNLCRRIEKNKRLSWIPALFNCYSQ